MSSLAKIRSDASSSAARPGVEVQLGGGVDQPLRLAHGERPAGGDLARPPRRRAARASPAGTTSLTRPIRSASAASMIRPVRIELLGPGQPDDPRQPLRPAAPGRHRQAHLGHAQPGPGRGDPQVAAQRQLQPAAQRVALDRGDGRHRQLRQLRGRRASSSCSWRFGRPGRAGPRTRRRASPRRRRARPGRSRPRPGRRPAGAASSVASAARELVEELARDQVERRVDELEVGDPARARARRARSRRRPRSRPRGPSARWRTAGDPSSAGRRRRAAGSPSGPARRARRRCPGATSVRTSPSSASAKTARSVM